MRIAVFSDTHLVSPADKLKERHTKRAHMVNGWWSFKQLLVKIESKTPDLIISCGDLVDWFSEENVEFALELLAEINIPWLMVPGNHDLNNHNPEQSKLEKKQECLLGWQQKGIELGNRFIDADGVKLILLDSALSSIPEGTEEWIASAVKELSAEDVIVAFTHVPLKIPEVCQYIKSIDPRKDLSTYTLQTPQFFEHCLAAKIDAIYSGHLHFPGTVKSGNVIMHMLSTSFIAEGRSYLGMGSAVILDIDAKKRVLNNTAVFV